ncbi:MAG TPA: hypothetical protein VKY65_14665 [Alphaproteobacteria bacterium]|nr:hypothetical protein [Alphaproteobacteria bacterium]
MQQGSKLTELGHNRPDDTAARYEAGEIYWSTGKGFTALRSGRMVPLSAFTGQRSGQNDDK